MSTTLQCKLWLSIIHVVVHITRSYQFNFWHLYSYFSLTAGGFIDTTPGSDHYGKFRVSSEVVRQTIR